MRHRIPSFTVFAMAFGIALAATAASAGVGAPGLRVASADRLDEITVEWTTADGRSDSRLLRRTPEPVVPGPAAWSAEGRTGFVSWTEGGTERWTSYTLDGGGSWSEPRPISLELALTAGRAGPGEAMPASRSLALPPQGDLFIVQLASITLPAWRDELADRGVTLLKHVPHHAFVARVDPAAAAGLETLPFVERVEPFHPAYRLEEALADWLESGDLGPGASPEVRVRVMAFEWGAAAKGRIADAAEDAGGRVAAIWPSGHVLELWLDRPALRQVAAHPDVMWIDRWTPREDDMDLVREDSGTNYLETTYGICGQGVRGEVLDSGIQSDHPDFGGRILHHGSFDLSSHGTSTYGIVFGDGTGDATATGHMPCPEAQGIFADYGFLTDRFAHTQELKNDPYFASFQTNSWGNARTRDYTSISAEMDDIIWRLDIAITQSQSNAGNQDSRPQAWAKNIVAVGGIRHFNTLDTGDDAWNGSASIGPASDGRIKPDVSYWYDSIRTTTTGSGYTSFGGTSASTPEVAGVLGLMAKLWSDNAWGTNPTGSTVFERQPHASTFKALLVNNAQQYPFVGTTADLTRVHQGWGRPSSRVADERAAISFIVDESDVLTVGQTASYNLDVAAGESELKVTMVYPDPPASPGAAIHRVNDLSLRVVSPSGTVYHGNNGLDAGNYSAAGGSPNTIDTVENVFVQSPESGSWTVEVTATEVNEDAHLATPGIDAVFALVVTGADDQPAVCGNGVREGAEECDGADLGGQTCGDFGCLGGTLSCTASCTLDTSACTDCGTCGNGTCDLGEDCTTCPSDCSSGSAASCGNGICETADGEDCLTCAADCNGQQTGKPGNRFCCGADVGCADPRCVAGGLSCIDTPAGSSCCGDGLCTGTESACSCAIDCGGPTGEGAGIAGSCSDGVDNDCDGDVDCVDAGCLSDPACVCGNRGDLCAVDGDCCSGACKNNGTCR